MTKDNKKNPNTVDKDQEAGPSGFKVIPQIIVKNVPGTNIALGQINLREPIDCSALEAASLQQLLPILALENDVLFSDWIAYVSSKLEAAFRRHKKTWWSNKELKKITDYKNLFDISQSCRLNALYAFIIFTIYKGKAENLDKYIDLWLKKTNNKQEKAQPDLTVANNYHEILREVGVELTPLKSFKPSERKKCTAKNLNIIYERCRTFCEEKNKNLNSFYIKLLNIEEVLALYEDIGFLLHNLDVVLQKKGRIAHTILTVGLPNSQRPYCVSSASSLAFKDFATFSTVFAALQTEKIKSRHKNFISKLAKFTIIEYGVAV